MSFELYTALSEYGDVFEMKKDFYKPDEFVKWTEENFEYVRYNPRKDVARLKMLTSAL